MSFAHFSTFYLDVMHNVSPLPFSLSCGYNYITNLPRQQLI
ncbi:hypothetical protein VP424E501_P0111 [Vibrio phage 424E50-1]|nr:hypothetical protein VP424E501_P0111 [Vibrio phage 424E50-1]